MAQPGSGPLMEHANVLKYIRAQPNPCIEPNLRMLSLRHSLATISIGLEPVKFGKNRCRSRVECAAKGPRPRYPRVWKTKRRIGTISKSLKLVECIKGLSNVKEEVYGALDSFVAWDLEFPLITVKKALKSLENEKEWKRIIQVTKWMLSKGQGRTMGSYYILLNALAEDGRLDEAEELWQTLFSQNIESMPRMFFERMISIYYRREMHDKMFEIFADMEELGIRPSVPIVTMVGDVFKKLDMLDKFEKLKRKYPPPKWEYRYIKGKRVKIRSKYNDETEGNSEENNSDGEDSSDALELPENAELSTDNCDEEKNLYLPETTYSHKTD
ncbi:Pentatricopeptide repeat superfamily protein [Perilla frutescens var. hirtella]|uniref:Pentatricopeptide repeat superfamily protein n=1 Tax=Perilla frutescens var. hirtella TaxID=608512 RepID=A0AAD4PCZ1_PERFH|nr:Pentatricopeptide repeat superfamily protein [Perilla frutescens var. hirtella]